MKIATWNVNSLRVRLPQVLDWLAREEPDVLALQETKLKNEDFPADELAARGYTAHFSGQAAYNGVAILSKEPGEDLVTEIDSFEDEQRRVLAATIGGVRIYDLYVPNGQNVDSDKYRYKLDWLAALEEQIARELAANRRLIMLGDFNIAPTDADVHDPEAWRGKVLCSGPERQALESLLGRGFRDVFRGFEQGDKSFSWWDYRAGAFRRNRGLRIDLILASERVAERCTACWIDREPRGLERPSDHAPVIAEFDI